MFELNQLRCFVAVAEELHFGRAAERVNLSQPPLSRQIQILERILGVSLLERSSRAVSLTPAGKAFLPDAKRILGLAESAALTVHRAASGEIGTIALGFTASTGYSLLPQLIAHVRQELPGLDLTLREMVTREQHEALLSGGIDVGVLREGATHDDLESMHLVSEPMVLAAPMRGSLSGIAPHALKDFDDLPIVMYAPEGARYFYDLLQSLFTTAGVMPRYVQFVTQIHSMLALVDGGLGFAIVPASAMALRFAHVAFSRPDDDLVAAELNVMWRRDNSNPALERFVREVGAIRSLLPDASGIEKARAPEPVSR